MVIGRKSVHGVVREGIGIIQERQILYLLLNAFQEPDFSLVSVYLQLPFLERIHYLRGLYLVPDYNQNPIARRIVLVKLADHYTPEEFERVFGPDLGADAMALAAEVAEPRGRHMAILCARCILNSLLS